MNIKVVLGVVIEWILCALVSICLYSQFSSVCLHGILLTTFNTNYLNCLKVEFSKSNMLYVLSKLLTLSKPEKDGRVLIELNLDLHSLR